MFRFAIFFFMFASLCTPKLAEGQTEYQQQIAPKSGITLSPTSPLATDGKTIFALDETRHVVVMTSLTESFDWAPLVRVEKSRIISITASPNQVYILDENGSIFWVRSGTLSRESIPQETLARILATETPHLRQIDYSAGCLFLLGDTFLYRLSLESGSLLGKFSLPSQRALTLVGQGNDIFFAEPETGNVYQMNSENGTTWLVLGEAGKVHVLQNLPNDVVLGPNPSSALEGFKSNALAVYAREIYAIDQSSKDLFVFSLHNRKPCRIEYRNVKLGNPSSILATRDSIYVLDISSQRLLRLPRLIPAEVKFDTSDSIGPQLAIFEFLKRGEILPIRSIVVSGGVDQTLSRAGIGSSANEPALNSFLCSLNSRSCTGGDVRSISDGIDLLLPDLYSEHIIDIKEVELGGQPLRDEISKAIIDPNFESWKDSRRVASLNNVPTTSELLDTRTGKFKIYVEKTRLVAAFYQDDLLDPGSPLQALKKNFKNRVSIISLLETSSSSATAARDSVNEVGNEPAKLTRAIENTLSFQEDEDFLKQQPATSTTTVPDLSDNDKQTLSKEYKDLMAIIHYARPGLPEAYAQATPKVGIVEENVDTLDPDFDAESFEYLDQLVPIKNSSVVTSDTSLHKLRNFDETLDHGTSVAALIGARKMDIDGNGLAAPQVVMIAISSKDPPIGEEIRQAELLGTTIFNLSLSFDVGVIPQGLQDAIDQYRDSLFVVAAGHHTEEACKQSLTYYPVCWGDKPNVLTVAATGADGNSLMTKITVNGREIHGSDWSQRYVWIAAPGEGYHSSGRGGSYVPVRGTSFATPLVTATAALLYAEGLKSGPDIKTRIISTADYRSNLKEKVAIGGLLNVERALKFPRRTVLTNDDGSELVVDLVLGTDLVIPTATDNIKIALRNIKRVTREGNKFRIIYVEHDASTGNDVIRFIENVYEPTGSPWKFSYYDLDPQTSVHLKKVKADLGNFKDFTGPA
jgi:hypothetical protein